MTLAYPLNYIHVNQPFGANAEYYQSHFGTSGHMGIDFQADHGTPVYAAHDGFAFYVGPDSHGGDGIYLRFQDGGQWYTCIYWHLCALNDPQFAPLVGVQGREVKAGDLLGYADNTGAPYESSGDHLHFGLALCDENGTFLNKDNGFGGCINPAPYFTTSIPFQFENNLYLGLTSTDVKQLQIRLGVSPTSGWFGPLTLQAVLKYQWSNGITPTGFVGPLTRAKLNA